MKKSLREMSQEELLALPWNYPAILILPGRYYLVHGMIQIAAGPLNPFGSDILACIWKFDTEPTTWRVQIRSRRYVEENGDPFAKGEKADHKLWFSRIFEGSEEKIFEETENVLKTLAEAFSDFQKTKYYEPEWIFVRGGVDKFFECLEKNKPDWMNTQIVKP